MTDVGSVSDEFGIDFRVTKSDILSPGHYIENSFSNDIKSIFYQTGILIYINHDKLVVCSIGLTL